MAHHFLDSMPLFLNRDLSSLPHGVDLGLISTHRTLPRSTSLQILQHFSFTIGAFSRYLRKLSSASLLTAEFNTLV